MKVFISFLLFSMLAITSLADDNREKKNSSPEPVDLSGIITDSETGETLIGVEVKLEGTDKKTHTDFDGNFRFERINPGEYNITAKYISYKSATIERQNIDFLAEKIHLKLSPLN
jgi:hypothetical protein